MSENIYAAPASSELPPETSTSSELATRKQRLLAAFADGMLVMLVFIGLVLLFSDWDAYMRFMAEGSIVNGILAGLAGVAIFLVLNGKLLVTNGQTLGKRSANIKIVALDDSPATVKGHLLKRYGFSTIIQNIPVVGPFIAIINILFIFGKQKRCLHDLVAGTKVVKC